MIKTKGSALNDSDSLAAGACQQMAVGLEDVLGRQLEKLRSYDIEGALALAEEASTMMESIKRTKWFDKPQFSGQARRIQKLYKEILLIIASEQQQVSGKLGQVRKGIKTLEACGPGN